MFFVIQSDERPNGYAVLSYAYQWDLWLAQIIPGELDNEVKRRLRSNLKHILVGLEFKAALITPHAERGPDGRPMLSESYFQNLIQEFCVGAFSVFEGLGAAHWMQSNGKNGAAVTHIRRSEWLPALCAVYDPAGQHDLHGAVMLTVDVRDRLHQDKLGAREDIDWHAFSYALAFAPASRGIRALLQCEVDTVPQSTNLV